MDEILTVCERVRPESFLQGGHADAPLRTDAGQSVLVQDENTLICAIDQKQIGSWADFEMVLSIVIENRLLKLYQGHLAKRFSQQIDEMLLEDGNASAAKKDKKQRKKKRNKRRNGERGGESPRGEATCGTATK